MSAITTNDGVELHYDVYGKGKPLLFATGWSCSSKFFDKNISVLAEDYLVITFDYRGHGKSEKPGHGYRIARFAMDTRNLITELGLSDITAIGWSMGAAVFWSYFELFGPERISKFISIDQSPRQYVSDDWELGQKSCYDVEAFTRLVKDIEYDEEAVFRDLLGINAQPRQGDPNLVDEMCRCSKEAKIEIMRDHTNLDWRDLLPRIEIPTLVLVGKQSEVFPWQGSAYVGEQIPDAETIFFEDCGHLLFWENAERFNHAVKEFVE